MNRGNTNTKPLRGGIDTQVLWGIRIGIIGRDCEPVAEARDAKGRLGFAVFGAAAHPVESYGQFQVGPVSAKLAQNLSGREFPAGREPASPAPGQSGHPGLRLCQVDLQERLINGFGFAGIAA